MTVERANSGFTLIELLVTVTVVALLVTLSIPSFRTWTANQQTRAVAEVIQNALRLAQATAIHQSHTTTLCLTDSTPTAGLVTDKASTNGNCTNNGKNWFIQMDALFNGESGQFVQGGSFGNIGPNVVITSPATAPVSFNSFGRTTAGATVTYQFTNPYGDFKSTTTRSLNITIDPGGQIRMCDSSRNIATSPDGC